MDKELQREIRALERRLAEDEDLETLESANEETDEMPVAEEEVDEVPVADEEEDIDQQIRALEKQIAEVENEEETPVAAEDDSMETNIEELGEQTAEDDDDLSKEIAALEEDLKTASEDETEDKTEEIVKGITDEELKGMADKTSLEDNAKIEDSFVDPSVHAGFNVEEDQNTKISKALIHLAGELVNPTEDKGKGILWQDKDVVEKLMGVKDKTDSGPGGDMLPVVQDNTTFTEGDYIYATRLKEASQRLDRVASFLEGKGGRWSKVAYRIDKISDAIDGQRKVLAKRIASKI